MDSLVKVANKHFKEMQYHFPVFHVNLTYVWNALMQIYLFLYSKINFQKRTQITNIHASEFNKMIDFHGTLHIKTDLNVMDVINNKQVNHFHVQNVNLIYVQVAVLSLVFKEESHLLIIINVIAICYQKCPKLKELHLMVIIKMDLIAMFVEKIIKEM